MIARIKSRFKNNTSRQLKIYAGVSMKIFENELV